MKKEIRLLVVDDHPVVLDGLKGMLTTEPDLNLVGEAANGVDAIRLADEMKPDVILMDLRMPEMDGVTAILQIKERSPEIQVLVLTTFDADADIERAVTAGATGYILKDAPRDEIFRAIRATAEGKPYLSSAVAGRLMDRQLSPSRGAEVLSRREIEVLDLVAKGTSNKEIARHLRLSEATVKSHLLHIYAKLDVKDRTQAVTRALKKNIIRLEQD
jgi:DNA-binding NarL/FixJ family response regulator